MKKYILTGKCLTIGVILFFIGTGIIPSIKSGLTHDKNIITVDDEPSDADFTSIKEAVNYSSPGDIIEVYSGTYPEDRIRIAKENISLLGISHELGEGNDSGKPFIRGNGTGTVIQVEASHVIVSNLRIENPWSEPLVFVYCIYVGTSMGSEQNNNTISDCIIRNSTFVGIRVGSIGKNIRIINNEISYCNNTGIEANSENFTITGNVITDCLQSGIYFGGGFQNVSGNRIRRCGNGIKFYGNNNIVYGNDIENCSVGVRNLGSWGNIITKNNFKNYSRGVDWWERYSAYIIWYILLGIKKDRWIGNYWDTWIGVGPKTIFGLLFLWFTIFGEFMLMFPIPWFDFDWHPAQEPYDITGMT